MALENWSRPVKQFTISIKRNQPEQVEDELGNLVLSDDLVVQMSEPEFTEFNETTSGWGFHDFHPLPLPMDIITDLNGKVLLQVEVSGSVVVNTSTIEMLEKIPFSSIIDNNSVESKAFGPEACQWILKLAIESDNCLSAYLCPVLTEIEEILGCHRVISTFSLNLCGDEDSNVISTKSLTGSFRFTESAPRAGWDKFADADNLKSFANLLFAVNITWDPTPLSEYTALGKTRVALANSIAEKSNIVHEKDYFLHEATRLNEELESWFSSFQDLDSKYQNLEKMYSEAENKLRIISTELDESRQDKNELQSSRVQLASVKERLAWLSNHMYNDTLPSLSGAEEPDELEVFDLRSKVAQVTHQKSDLELQVVKLQNEVENVTRQLSDSYVYSNNVAQQNGVYEIENDQSVESALETARIEIATCREAIQISQNKNRVSETLATLAGEMADLSMIQCGADVAYATLCEFAESGYPYDQQVEDIAVELQAVRRDLLHLRTSLMGDTNQKIPHITYDGVAEANTGYSNTNSPQKTNFTMMVDNQQDDKWQHLDQKLNKILTLTQTSANEKVEIEYEAWDTTEVTFESSVKVSNSKLEANETQ